jgi:hypothetical protein
LAGNGGLLQMNTVKDRSERLAQGLPGDPTTRAQLPEIAAARQVSMGAGSS